jgi:catechol 2,3-dioxygenase-like lactoylglutathione lyase family enzyme
MKGRIHHVGIVIDELAEARKFLEQTLGLKLDRAQSLPDTNMETAFFSYDGSVQIELVQIGDANVRARRLGEGTRSRLDHVAIEVDDIYATRDMLAQVGVGMQNETPSRNGPTRSFFSNPETTRGVVFQFLDRNV